MNEGYWINYKSGKEFRIHEHEQWIRTPGNAKKLGLTKNAIAGFSKFKQYKDRDKFLLFIMENAPVMRVRGHGSHVTFEYSSRNRRNPMDAIWMWGQENAGPYTQLNIVNFATHESVDMVYGQFEELMDVGPDEVMRAASVGKMEIKESIRKELQAVRRDLLLEMKSRPDA